VSESGYVEIPESKVLFDSDFRPYVVVKLRNNMNKAIIAVEVEVAAPVVNLWTPSTNIFVVSKHGLLVR